MQEKLILPEPAEHSQPSWFGFLMTVCEEVDCVKVVKYLESRGIQTRRLFSGNLLRHPCFDELRQSNTGYRVVGKLENTDRIMRDSFWIGVYPGMDGARIDYMIDVVKDAIGKNETA